MPDEKARGITPRGCEILCYGRYSFWIFDFLLFSYLLEINYPLIADRNLDLLLSSPTSKDLLKHCNRLMREPSSASRLSV